MLKMNIKSPQTLKLNYSGGSSIIIDDVPKENSKNAVSSGGVYQSLKELDNKIDNIDLSEYAKKDYVDEAVKNVEVDLSNYYTKKEVDNALENVSVDLSNYYTKEETVTLLTNKASIEYVNNAIETAIGNIDTILDNINGEVI